MFNKTLFDRNAFDRNVSSDGIGLATLGSGQAIFQLTVKTPIGTTINGAGLLVPNIRLQQHIIKSFDGVGKVDNITMILKQPMAMVFNSQGTLDTDLVVPIPIMSTLSGHSSFEISSKMFVYQNINGNLFGTSVFTPRPVLENAMIGDINGSSQMTMSVNLEIPLIIQSHGQGSFLLRRVGALNENVIELIGINFLPGETITIDTDLLQVLFGAIEDVSSITNESVFFELNPGENEITINTDTDSILEVVAIWQNRWL